MRSEAMQLKTRLAIALLAIGTAAAHAQQPAPPAATPPNAKPAPASTPAAATPAPATSPPDAAAAKPSAASKSSPQHFEPTEKVRPDFDVAFPVDI
jgi:hypothetical protein